MICSFIVLKCNSNVTKLVWCTVKICFPTISLIFITIAFKWKIFKFVSLIMFLTFFKIHEKTFKEKSWTFNENQNDDQMRWVFCLLFFSFIIVDTSLRTIWHESFTKITLLLSVSLCSTIICIYTILSLLTSELMEPFFCLYEYWEKTWKILKN